MQHFVQDIKTGAYYAPVNMAGLCGLVVRVPGYRFRGTGSIPGNTRFSEK
jgi:hypothetical protein